MLLIVFGAGASHDHDNRISQNENIVRLPLSNDLIKDNLHFVEKAKTKWSGAIPILNHLTEIKNSEGTFNLEESLYAEFERNNDAVKGQLLSFLFYIHDIIRNSEHQIRAFNQANTNYTKLLGLLQRNSIDEKGISLVTFNYDTLLESACTQTYPMWEFNDFDDYVNGLQKVRLYKPHGSINWKRIHSSILPNPNQVGVIKALLKPESLGFINSTEQISSYYFEHSEKIQGSNSITEPILALPYKEKTKLVFPQDHKMKLIRDMSNITHIITIGWKGEEKHFHNEILSEINGTNGVKVLNVNMGGVKIKQNLENSLGDKITEIHNFNQGFSSFLKDKTVLEEFLSN